jgi:NAD(P)H-hydrate epimerase
MLIVSSQQMAKLEKQAYARGASEENFMEEAGKNLADAIHSYCTTQFATLLVGKGNNGGDAFVCGRYLIQKGWQIDAIVVDGIKSPLSEKNKERFLQAGGKIVDTFPTSGILIDALFGTGFHGKPKEPFQSIISKANRSMLPIFSIDLPSGLNGDTGAVEGEAIKANVSFFLEFPKRGFFLQEGWNHVGKLHRICFGLPQELISTVEKDLLLLEMEDGRSRLPPIVPSRHKYQAGVVTALAGSPGMPGAACLASCGALRAGAGLVRLLHPAGMEEELAAAPYELIRIPYSDSKSVFEALQKGGTLLVGPGLGRKEETASVLKEVLEKYTHPLVIDADALTIIAEKKLKIPKGALLTPHIGEMIRLLPHSSPKPHTSEFLLACQHFVDKNEVTLVLKGGPTFIFHPSDSIYVSPFGDPGMATAGSGDVLAGILAALLSQGCTPKDSAILGVILHGLAGEIAAKKLSSYSLIATDLLNALGKAFLALK